MIAFLGALKEEVAGLQRALTLMGRRQWGPAILWVGWIEDCPAVVMRAGLGRHRAEAAARFLTSSYPLSALVCLGFGGGLTPALKAGDLVLCDQVYALNYKGGLEGPLASDEELVNAAVAALWQQGIAFHLGDALTVPGIVGRPRQKKEMGRRYGAAVVEMESYGVAQVARAAGVPFLAVRAISDEVKDLLPDVQRFADAAGRVQARKAMRYLVGHPEHAAALLRLGVSSRRAAASLTTFGLALAAALAPRSSVEAVRHEC